MMTNDYSLDIEKTLDACLHSIFEQGWSVDDCLAHYAGQREGLEPVLRLALYLRGAQTITAPAEFRRAARQRMNQRVMAAAARLPRRAAAAGGRRDWRESAAALFHRSAWSGAVLTLVCLVLALTTTLQVSARALPGDLLYPVKLGVENARLSFTRGNADRAQTLLDMTGERFVELVQVAEQYPTRPIERAALEFTLQLDSTLAEIRASASLTPEQRDDLVVRLNASLDEKEQTLQVIIEQPDLEASDRQALEQIRDKIRQIRVEVTGWIPLPALIPTILPRLSPPPNWPTEEFPGFVPWPTPPARATQTPAPRPSETARQATAAPPPSDEIDELITEWPEEWPTLEITPVPDPQWTEVNEPWPTLILPPDEVLTALPDLPGLPDLLNTPPAAWFPTEIFPGGSEP